MIAGIMGITCRLRLEIILLGSFICSLNIFISVLRLKIASHAVKAFQADLSGGNYRVRLAFMYGIRLSIVLILSKPGGAPQAGENAQKNNV